MGHENHTRKAIYRAWRKLDAYRQSSGRPRQLSCEKLNALVSVNLESYRIWTRKYVSVFLAPFPCLPFHLLITSNTPGRTLEQLKPIELQELEDTKRSILKALEELYGYNQYLAFHYSIRNQEPFAGRFCLELLPVKDDSSSTQMTDISEKLLRFDYLLYRMRLDRHPLPHLAASTHARTLRHKLQSLSTKVVAVPVKRSSSSLPWDLHLLHADKAWMRATDQLLKLVETTATLPESELLKTSDSDESEFSLGSSCRIQVDECPFCCKRVIEKQSLYRGKHVNVLCNAWPLHRKFHFLITPIRSRHVEKWEQLSQEELHEAQSCSAALFEAIRSVTGSSQIVSWISNGVAVGQSVPHTHTHVLAIPDSMEYYHLTAARLSGIKYQALSDEEIAAIRTQILPHFLPELHRRLERP